MNKFKIGTLVYCRSYICKSGNMFNYIKPEESQDGIPKCTLWNEYPHKYEEEVEDYMETDRYKKIEKCFKGIYVGTTSLCTKIFCSYDTWLDRDYFRFGKTAPKQFAVVYYADNKKRLVPIDDLEIINEEGAKMTDKELLTAYRQEMHKIQIKNGFTDEQMTSYRQGFMDAIREYEQRIAADVQEKRYCKMIPLEPDCRGYTDVFICTNCHNHIHLGFIRKEYSGSYCLECGAEVKDGDSE